MIYSLGIDPGATTGIALLSCEEGKRPLVRRAWVVRGKDLDIYGCLAYDIIGRALDLHRIATDSRDRLPVWIEEVPSFGRASVAASIARRQGILIGACALRGLGEPTRINPLAWAGLYGGHVRKGKAEDADHRRVEARTLFDGSELLEEMPVDVTEAALIAGAGFLSRGGWKLDHIPQVGKKVRAPRKPRGKKG
jgi:hypothetical protein